MSSFTFVLLAASLLLTTSSAAPQNTKLGITIPEECRGKGFCSIRPEGYDEIEAQINDLLPLHLIEVDSRSGGGPIGNPSDDDDNCPSDTTWESVYAYDDPKGTEIDIIVQTKLFPQKFATVTCKFSNKEYKNLEEDDSQCFKMLRLSELNLKSSCKESYATRTLLVYDPKVNILKMKDYTVPVCCSCAIWNN